MSRSNPEPFRCFRGLPVPGCSLQPWRGSHQSLTACAAADKEVPEDFSVVCTTAHATAGADGAVQQEWRVESTATKLRLWDHALPPASTNARVRALEWLRVAPALHAAVPVQHVEAALASGEAAPCS